MKPCIFCNIPPNQKDEVIGETNNFFVKINVGMISPGHVMIISKSHLKCFGELSDELDEEFQNLKNIVHSAVQTIFSEPFLIEYGIWGQSVHHAHIHFIPLKSKDYVVKSIIKEMISPLKINFEETSWAKIKKIYKTEGSYVAIEEKGKVFVCHTKDLTSRENYPDLLCRTFFARVKGLSGVGDYRKMSADELGKDRQKRLVTKKLMESTLRKEISSRAI